MYLLFIIIIIGFLAAVALPPSQSICQCEHEIKESKQRHINKEDTTTTSRCRRKKISSDHGVTIEPMPIYSLHNPFMFYQCLTRKYVSLSLSLTTLKDRATQLLIKYKSGALVTQIMFGHQSPVPRNNTASYQFPLRKLYNLRSLSWWNLFFWASFLNMDVCDH